MIISSPEGYRLIAKRKLPRFLFDYIDGGANSEETLERNTADLRLIALRQRVLRGSERVDLGARLFESDLALPIALGPVGLTGMYAKRGEVQAAKAATVAGVPLPSPRCPSVPSRKSAIRSPNPSGFSSMS